MFMWPTDVCVVNYVLIRIYLKDRPISISNQRTLMKHLLVYLLYAQIKNLH